jgi:hypothetical protein
MSTLELEDAIDALEGKGWQYYHLLPSAPAADLKQIVFMYYRGTAGKRTIGNIIECHPVVMRLLEEHTTPFWRQAPVHNEITFCGQYIVANDKLDLLTIRVSYEQ